MARFCSNCGAQLEDEDKVCGNCGQACSKIGGGALNQGKKKKDRSGKKRVKGKTIFILIVLLIVLAIVVKIVSSFIGYRGVLRKTMKAFEDYDMDTLEFLASDINQCGMFGEDTEDYFSNIVSEQLDLYESTVGHDLKISYEVNEIYELPERKLEKMFENLEKEYDYDTSGIEKVMVVDMTITTKGSKKTENWGKDTLLLLKENGEWQVYDNGLCNLY